MPSYSSLQLPKALKNTYLIEECVYVKVLKLVVLCAEDESTLGGNQRVSVLGVI